MKNRVLPGTFGSGRVGYPLPNRLKTLDELKMIVMKELCVNPTVHNIQITYRMPHEVLKHRINYKHMAIEADKHVKTMFDKLERIPKVNGFELYIQLELRAEVEDDDDDDDDDDDNDDDYVDETAINLEDFVDRDEYEERIERGDFGDFERDIDDDETLDDNEPNADNVIIVQNITNTISTYAPLALSFSANTLKNMVDPSNNKIPFVSTWRGGDEIVQMVDFCQ
ncbi:hypothetical protein SO802_015708 [Lithocarpus litseifolius]|uniref:Uncharacterized protein n=1 Tax=Lithocarpus litseifolius TaxID=425828 RepID=A0AAW2CUF7_9ROSI